MVSDVFSDSVCAEYFMSFVFMGDVGAGTNI